MPYADHSKQMYACKVFDIDCYSKSELLMAFKEIKISNMLKSEICIQHYQTVKTSNKIYMIQEYTNCLTLECLLEQRGTLK